VHQKRLFKTNLKQTAHDVSESIRFSRQWPSLAQAFFKTLSTCVLMVAAILFRDRVSADALSGILERHFSDMLVLSLQTDSGQVSEALQQVHPDILFLETEVEYAWFGTYLAEVAVRPDIILVGAAEPPWHLIIRFEANDYLPTPIIPESLFLVIRRTQTHINKHIVSPAVQAVERIMLATLDGFVLVGRQEIIRLEADGSYTKIFLIGKESMLISKNIGQIHEAIRKWHFQRIHKSHIINLSHLVRYIRGSGGEVLLADNSRIPVSRECKAGLIEALRSLPGVGQL